MEMDEMKKGTSNNFVPFILWNNCQDRELFFFVSKMCLNLLKWFILLYLRTFYSADLSTHAAERGRLPVFNESEENSATSSTNDTHSSLNTEEEDEELAYGMFLFPLVCIFVSGPKLHCIAQPSVVLEDTQFWVLRSD